MSFDAIWKFCTGFLDQMTNWTLPVLIFVTLLAICHSLVCMKDFPNKYIWMVVTLVGILGFVFGGDPTMVTVKGNPRVILGMYGVIVSGLVLIIHNAAYRALRDKLPALFNETDPPTPNPAKPQNETT
jgi:hypothetical protein